MRSEGAEGSSASSDCDDPLVVIACAAESSACPAACREDAKEDEQAAPKSGDLVVTATAAAGKSVIVGGVNDLDTLTFKTSEEVELTKVVLERYGYSTTDDVISVRLEDENGNKIADERSLNNKDQATLSIKKEYRSIDGSFNATVVAKVRKLHQAVGSYVASEGVDAATDALYAAANNGSSLGFKVIDATSTAKNVDLGGYGANLYDIVSYTAGTLTLNTTAANKSYNYEAGESYEMAKFKLTNNGTNAISVNGFTLHNYGTLAAEDFVKDVVVTANGEEVKGAKASFNKDDELVVSFKDYEIAANRKVTFAVSASLSDEFDEYNRYIAFALQDADDVNAVENKTSARVTVVPANALGGVVHTLQLTAGAWEFSVPATPAVFNPWTWPVYSFNGGKVKLTNTKLGNIDAAAGSTDVVVAEGTLSISEPIKTTFTLSADKAGIDSLTMVIAGEEYDSRKSGTDFIFNNIEIEKGGKVQFKVDIDNDDNLKGTVISIDTFRFQGTNTYVENKAPVAAGDIAGSITFSKITVQAAKASLENNLSKGVEFIKNEASRKVIFDGVYAAKKADVYLNEIQVTGTLPGVGAKVTLYLSVDGDEVAYVDLNDSQTFSNVLIKAGESAKIKVEAEVDSPAIDTTGKEYTIVLKGEDLDNLPIKDATANTVLVKVVNKGSVTVSTAAASKSTVLLKAANVSIAKFTVKPENSSDEDLYLEDLLLTVDNGTPLGANAIRVKVDGVEEDGNDYPLYSATTTYAADDMVVDANGVAYKSLVANNLGNALTDAASWDKQDTIALDLNEKLGEGIDVEVVLKNKTDAAGTVTVTVNKVNGNAVSGKIFTKRFEPVLVTLHTEDKDGTTKVYLGVEKENSSDRVSNVIITVEGTIGAVTLTTDEVADGDDFEVSAAADKSTHFITNISYCINKDATNDCSTPAKGLVSISKATYNDYFKDGDSYAKIFKVD